MTRQEVYKEIEGMFGLVPGMFKALPDSSLETEWQYGIIWNTGSRGESFKCCKQDNKGWFNTWNLCSRGIRWSGKGNNH